MQLFASTQALKSGYLPVEDGHAVFWQTFGNPAAPPIVLLHGGPGGGTRPAMVQLFDPQRWHVVTVDQRGSGRSTPHAGDNLAALRANTTDHLIRDLERLRLTLGIGSWHIYGSSWGTALALSYALEHRKHVNGMILASVATCAREDLDFLYYGGRLFLPDAHELFHELVPDARDGIEIAAGYGDLLTCADPAINLQAARRWCAWEEAVVSHDARFESNSSYQDDRFCLGFSRIVTSYFRNNAWIETPLSNRAHELDGMDVTMIHSRLDLSAPLKAPWELHKKLPLSKLLIVPGGLHATLYGPLSEAIVKSGNSMLSKTSDCL